MSVVDHGTPPEYAFAEHEHRELGRGVDNIHEVGRQVGNITSADLAAAIGGVLEWLNRVLAPHIAWEEAELYPRVDERATSPWATKMMRFEHYQIREAAERLEHDRELLLKGVTRDHVCDVRAHLFGLEAVLRSHIAREELFLLPLLVGEQTQGIPG